MALHIVNIPPSSAQAACFLRQLRNNDKVIFTGMGLSLLDQDSPFLQDIRRAQQIGQNQFYALRENLDRSLTGESPALAIDINGFVALTVEHEKIVSWF